MCYMSCISLKIYEEREKEKEGEKGRDKHLISYSSDSKENS